jgi:hypothetical protein
MGRKPLARRQRHSTVLPPRGPQGHTRGSVHNQRPHNFRLPHIGKSPMGRPRPAPAGHARTSRKGYPKTPDTRALMAGPHSVRLAPGGWAAGPTPGAPQPPAEGLA